MSVQLDLMAAIIAKGIAIQRRLEKKKLRAAQRHRQWTAKRMLDETVFDPAEFPNLAEADRAMLYKERVTVTRPGARQIHLARMFLAGTPYAEAEVWCYKPKYTTGPMAPVLNFDKIYAMAQQYHEGSLLDLAQRFEQWKQAADAHLAAMDAPDVRREKLRQIAKSLPPKPIYTGPKDPVLQAENRRMARK